MHSWTPLGNLRTCSRCGLRANFDICDPATLPGCLAGVTNTVAEEPQNEKYIFRSYAEAAADCRKWAANLPDDIVGVCGVPRGGVIIASMLAQIRNLPLVEFSQLIAGQRPWLAPIRRHFGRQFAPRDGAVLLVDDTCYTGHTLRTLKPKLSKAACRIEHAALYAGETGLGEIAHHHGFMPHWFHSFEWNIFHDVHTPNMLTDLDGVICPDFHGPDTGDNLAAYEQHISNAEPLLVPTHRVQAIVTGRVERYRAVTEKWLNDNGVQYVTLKMMPFESNEARNKSGHFPSIVARYKAEQYDLYRRALLFVESDESQAGRIAAATGRSVLAWPSFKKFNCGEPQCRTR